MIMKLPNAGPALTGEEAKYFEWQLPLDLKSLGLTRPPKLEVIKARVGQVLVSISYALKVVTSQRISMVIVHAPRKSCDYWPQYY